MKFNVLGSPSCALVHKKKVLCTGDPSDRNLESDISGLIEGKLLEHKPSDEREVEKTPQFSTESHDELISKARESSKSLLVFIRICSNPKCHQSVNLL